MLLPTVATCAKGIANYSPHWYLPKIHLLAPSVFPTYGIYHYIAFALSILNVAVIVFNILQPPSLSYVQLFLSEQLL